MEWYAQNWHELGTTVNEAAFSISLIIEESDEKVVAMDGIYAFDEEFLRDLLVAHLDLVREDVNTINANTARGNKLFLRNRVIVGMVWYTKNWRRNTRLISVRSVAQRNSNGEATDREIGLWLRNPSIHPVELSRVPPFGR